MFIITGLIDNKEHSLSFDNGKLSGSDVAVRKAVAENKKDHGLLGMWSGFAGSGEYLLSGNQYSAYALCITFVFDKILTESNDWQEIPEGAIA